MKVVQDPATAWIADHWVDQPAEKDALIFSVLQVPMDFAVSHRPGTRFGPAGVVAAINGFSLYCTDKRVNLEQVRFLDLGEVDIVHSLPESYRRIAEAASRVPSMTLPIFLGGDHSITDPLFRSMQSRAPNQHLGLVVFDAHFDSREPLPGKEHSGHWMCTLGDVLDYGRVAQLGINAPIYSEHYMSRAEGNGVLVRTPYEIRRQGWAESVREAVEHVSGDTDGVYVSVDIDCVDQAFAPGTSVPNATGLLPFELADAVFELSSMAEIVALDITEVSPPLDKLDYTCQLAAHVVLNHIAGVVTRHNLLRRQA
jgi:agmatinase